MGPKLAVDAKIRISAVNLDAEPSAFIHQRFFKKNFEFVDDPLYADLDLASSSEPQFVSSRPRLVYYRQSQPAQQWSLDPNLIGVVWDGMSEDSWQCLHQRIMGKLANARKLRQLLDQARDQDKDYSLRTQALERESQGLSDQIFVVKSQSEMKLKRWRSVVGFMKDLSRLVTVEDLLLLLRKEMKPFHGLKDPLLHYSDGQGRAKVLFFQGSQLKLKKASASPSSGQRISLNDLEDSRYLANELMRPVAKLIRFPLLHPKGIKEWSREATLFVEHSLTASEVEEFIQFIVERLQSLAVVLDRILIETSLKNASLMWERTFDGIEDPICILDEEYHVLRSNKAFNPGTRMDEMCFEQFAGRDESCIGCPVRKVFAQHQPTKGRVQREQRIYMVNSYPIRAFDWQHPTTVVNHYLDITKQTELQTRVVQNEKMATIGQLAGHIAHELNNPLTGILSLAQVLETEIEKDSQLFNDLKEVESATERCQRIIRNLLEFSQGGETSLQKIHLNELVKRTLPLLKTAIGLHRSEIKLDAIPDLVQVEPQLVQQVVFNLVNNACQAMASQGLIEIISRIEDGFICLDVKDSGEGIAPENLQHIFMPFFTTKPAGKGTGLGLSMSRSLVEKFGGTIAVESVLGQGSCFTVKLPLFEAFARKGQK